MINTLRILLIIYAAVVWFSNFILMFTEKKFNMGCYYALRLTFMSGVLYFLWTYPVPM